jgi:hypothetical protein
MRNPVWAYGGGLLALAGATVLMGMNISAALGGDPAPWPTVWRVTGAVLGDVGAACLPFAALRAHRNGALGMAAVLALIWAGSCSYTVFAATKWNIAQASAVRDPLARARWAEATAQGTYEQQIKLTLANLGAARSASIDGRTQQIRSDALVAAKSAQEELARLGANPPAASKGSGAAAVEQAFSEWPWFWPVMLLVFSQAGWAVIAVAQNEAGRPGVQISSVRSMALPGARPAPGKPTNIIRFVPAHERLAEQVRALRDKGHSQAQIAEVVGTSRSSVQRMLKKLEAGAASM